MHRERSASADPPFLRFTFRPLQETFGSVCVEGLYQIAGNLRVLSCLRAGLGTSLQADLLDHELRYYYQDGLRSLLFEEDYARWPLHPGCLSFQASGQGMSVEGHLRFLHAGTPHVRTFVNYHPSQGGTDLEGLGKALVELFPDPSQGCRQLVMVTNPDTGAQVRLPHSFIGGMHLRIDEPRYFGPTKDVLANPEVCGFVHEAAKQIKEQWESLKRK